MKIAGAKALKIIFSSILNTQAKKTLFKDEERCNKVAFNDCVQRCA